MVLEHVKAGWNAYVRNFWEFVAAYVVLYGFLLAMIVIAVMPLIPVGVSAFSSASVSELLRSNVSYLLVSALLIAITFLFALALQGGIVKMAGEALRKGTKLGTMINTAKEKFLSIVLADVLSLLVMIGLLILMALPAIVFPPLVMLSVLAWMFATLLFKFVEQSVVLENRSPFEAVKRSVAVARSRYVDVVLILLMALVTEVVLGMVPVFGLFLQLFLAAPVFLIAFTSLFLSKGR